MFFQQIVMEKGNLFIYNQYIYRVQSREIMRKFISITLLSLFTVVLISGCSSKAIHTSKDRPESFIEFVQED